MKGVKLKGVENVIKGIWSNAFDYMIHFGDMIHFETNDQMMK